MLIAGKLETAGGQNCGDVGENLPKMKASQRKRSQEMGRDNCLVTSFENLIQPCLQQDLLSV